MVGEKSRFTFELLYTQGWDAVDQPTQIEFLEERGCAHQAISLCVDPRESADFLRIYLREGSRLWTEFFAPRDVWSTLDVFNEAVRLCQNAMKIQRGEVWTDSQTAEYLLSRALEEIQMAQRHRDF